MTSLPGPCLQCCAADAADAAAEVVRRYGYGFAVAGVVLGAVESAIGIASDEPDEPCEEHREVGDLVGGHDVGC